MPHCGHGESVMEVVYPSQKEKKDNAFISGIKNTFKIREGCADVQCIWLELCSKIKNKKVSQTKKHLECNVLTEKNYYLTFVQKHGSSSEKKHKQNKSMIDLLDREEPQLGFATTEKKRMTDYQSEKKMHTYYVI